MPANPINERLEELQRQVHHLEARSQRKQVSPLFTLAIGGLIGAVISLMVLPGTKTPGSAAGVAASASGGAGGTSAATGIGAQPMGAGASGYSTGGPGSSPGTATGSASGASGGPTGSAGTGSSGADSGGGTATGTAGGGGISSGSNNGGLRGVTPTSVKVGLLCIDTTAFKAAYPNYYTGPCTDYLSAQVAYLHKTGQDVVNGRKVDYVVRSVPVSGLTDTQGFCDQWAQQDRFFAVAGDYVGFPCFAQQYGQPTINWSGTSVMSTSQLNSYGPYYFQVGPVLDQVYRNLIAWASAKGYLKGKRIGVHYPAGYPPGLVANSLIGALARAGYPACSTPVATSCVAATTTFNVAQGDLTGNSGQPDNEVAVQKFIAAKVTLALPLGGSAVVSQFTNDAQQQNFYPKWLGFDDDEMTTDSVSQYFQPQEYDNTPAVSFYQYGERNAGITPSPQQTRCIQNYEDYSHVKVDYKQESVSTADVNHKPEATPYHILLALCDEVAAVQAGLQGAGHTLTPQTFRAALEGAGNVPMNRISGLGWSPTRHWGGTAVREMTWHRSCLCYIDTSGPLPPASS